MSSVERGKRIKEARLSKKMTQSDVVGSFITRNMLSQIESGAATPSVKTLEYLAGVLEIPVSELLPGGDEKQDYIPPLINNFIEAKSCYKDGDYDVALELLGVFNNSEYLSDEFQALSALIYVKLAEKNAEHDGNIKSLDLALEYAEKAVSFSELGLFANPFIKEKALRLKSSYAKKLSEYYAGMVK